MRSMLFLLAVLALSAPASASAFEAPQGTSPPDGSTAFVDTAHLKGVPLTISTPYGTSPVTRVEASISPVLTSEGAFNDPLAAQTFTGNTHDPYAQVAELPWYQFEEHGGLYAGTSATVYWHPYASFCEPAPVFTCKTYYGAIHFFVYTTALPAPPPAPAPSAPPAAPPGPSPAPRNQNCAKALRIARNLKGRALEAQRRFENAPTLRQRRTWKRINWKRLRNYKRAVAHAEAICPP